MVSQLSRYARWFRNVNLQARLVIVFVLLLLMVVLNGGSGLFFAKQVGVSVDTLTDVALPSLDAIHSLTNDMKQMNIDLLTVLDRQDNNRNKDAAAALSDFYEISRARMDRLNSLLEVSGIDLDIGMVRDLQQTFVSKARNLLNLHGLKLASQGVAIERLEELVRQRNELDTHLAQLASFTAAAMAVREEASKTLVQSGKATVERIDELNDATFNQFLPLLQGAYKLMRFLVQIQELSRSYVATTHTDQLDVLERNVLLLIKRSKSRLKKTINRANTPEEKAQLKMLPIAFTKLEALILAEDGLFAAHLKSLDASEASVALKKSLVRTSKKYSVALKGIAEMVAIFEENANQSANTSIANALLGTSIVIGLGLLLAGLLWWMLSHAIVRPQVKQLEELRRSKAQIEIANRAKSEFLATMSHELRTPLNAVIGFSEIIKDEMLGPVGSAKYRDYAEDINDSGQHLLGLINDILDLSKIESGTDELNEDTIEVPKIIRSALKLVGHRAEQGGVKLEIELADQLPALRADERKLKQILVNLLSNAIKFTDAGGEVALWAWCRMGSGYVFQIIDTGIGIAPNDIPRALSRFGQVDGGLNRKYEGTGLGLPLTKALVEQHGGVLDLQSQVGVGTTVTVRFPAERIVTSLGHSDSLDMEVRAAS